MSVAPSLIWAGRAIGDPTAAALTGVAVPADTRDPNYGAWTHFRRRVRERIGGDVDPVGVWCALIAAIRSDRTDLVRCLGRLNRDGRRVWEFRVDDARLFYAVYDHRGDTPVTVLTARQWRSGRRSGVRRLQGREIE